MEQNNMKDCDVLKALLDKHKETNKLLEKAKQK